MLKSRGANVGTGECVTAGFKLFWLYFGSTHLYTAVIEVTPALTVYTASL